MFEKGPLMMSRKLLDLSKEELVARIESLESQLGAAAVGPKAKKKMRSSTNQRPFDLDQYPKAHVALKIAYMGWNYCGFASQTSFKAGVSSADVIPQSHIPTVEEELFRALMTTRLIQSPGTSAYSRCGRTDAGVSAVGQVVGVTVRASAVKGVVDQQEIISLPLVSMLNRTLPQDIRVLGYRIVDGSFNAR